MNERCIEYRGLRTPKGYGLLWIPSKKRVMRAHRWAWEVFNGDIPPGRMVLHHCDNPACINPTHLYAGTAADNSRDRSVRKRDRGWARPSCGKGHLFTERNTYQVGKGSRDCRTCRAARARTYYSKRKREEPTI